LAARRGLWVAHSAAQRDLSVAPWVLAGAALPRLRVLQRLRLGSQYPRQAASRRPASLLAQGLPASERPVLSASRHWVRRVFLLAAAFSPRAPTPVCSGARALRFRRRAAGLSAPSGTSSVRHLPGRCIRARRRVTGASSVKASGRHSAGAVAAAGAVVVAAARLALRLRARRRPRGRRPPRHPTPTWARCRAISVQSAQRRRRTPARRPTTRARRSSIVSQTSAAPAARLRRMRRPASSAPSSSGPLQPT
jgi:hypothetical protein